jgi:serine/threonine protein kinase
MSEETLFADVLEQPPADRQRFLEEACGTDAGLLNRLRILLAAHEKAAGILDQPGQTPDSLEKTGGYVPAGEHVGQVVAGRYKLLEQIGEGGMGAVWVAEQTQPVRRKVALKLIKAGMDSKTVLSRFEAERQALALMDHPNIAKILDGGATESGRPFFAMEYVKGVPFTQYCDAARLSVADRLELFVPVCQAVQHAHQKGIIHRDLKPSNILICLYDGQPVPKVIDFGLAKAMHQPLTEHTLYTAHGLMMGTPLYMSPEQAEFNNLDVDTRTDIYALGVILYELLTGTTPLENQRMKTATWQEILRLIKDEEPPRPSTRLSGSATLTSVAAQRRLEPVKLTKLVRGELDWIVMKCLDKERGRRYETANGLARDIGRYLDDEPVEACPPSRNYRLRKFAGKNKRLLATGAAFAMLLVAAAIVSSILAVRALEAEHRLTTERNLALQERQKAEENFALARAAVDKYFTKVGDSRRLKARGLETLRKELLQQAKEFYEAFTRERANDPGLRHDVAMAYYRLARIERDLGQFPAAEEQYTKSIALMEEMARNHPEEPDYQNDLALGYLGRGDVYKETARHKEAEAAYQQALGVSEKLSGAHPDVAIYRHGLALGHYHLGLLYFETDQIDRVESLYQQSLAIWTKLVRDHPQSPNYRYSLANVHRRLGAYYESQGRSDKAEAATKQAISAFEELDRQNPDEPTYQENLAESLGQLGNEYHGTAQFEKAEEAHRRSLAIREKLAREHPEVLDFALSLGVGYASLGLECDVLGKADEALALFDKGTDACQRVLDREPRHSRARLTLINIRLFRAVVNVARGDYVRAVQEGNAVARQEDLKAVHIYNLGCVFSRSSAAAAKDPKLPPAEQAALKEQYALRGMEFLRQALAKGYLHPHFKNDADLDPVRGREDFKKLMREFEEKVKAGPVKR